MLSFSCSHERFFRGVRKDRTLTPPVFLLLLFLLILTSCYDFDNPVDPAAASYQGPSSGPDWLSGWTFRKEASVGGSTWGGVSDYPLRVTVHFSSGTDSGEDIYLAGRCRTDFADIRFTREDGQSFLNYWLQKKTDSDIVVFWVKVPSIPASGGTTFLCYYGNPSAGNAGSGEATFLLFDDFNGTGIDTDRWGGDTGYWTCTDVEGNGNGVAVCSVASAKLASSLLFDDIAFFGSVKCEVNTSGYLGMRDAFSVSPSPTASRYDIFFEALSGPVFTVSLRKIALGSTETLVYESSSYSDGYQLVAIHAQAGKLGGVFESLSFSYNDNAYLSAGGVSIGTGPTMSNTLYVDWVAARPYVIPEPDIQGWAEEEEY